MNNLEFTVSKENEFMRLDKYLNDNLSDFSRSHIKNLITDENILVNNLPTKANYKIKEHDIITINIPEVKELEVIKQNIKLDIYYEDKDVLVVNKPSGMVVHPGNGNDTDTLVNALMYHIKDLSGIGGVLRPGIVHRIDKETSGLLMIAKNDKAHQHLAKQLKDKTVTRKYLALVDGVIPHNQGRIDAPIGRDPKNRIAMTVIDGGKNAVTNFNVLERYTDKTLIECILETGRTHQIRVHLKYIGFPLVGDPVYGRKKVFGEDGQYLHAQVLGFIHPTTNKYLEFNAPIPDYYEQYLKELRNNN